MLELDMLVRKITRSTIGLVRVITYKMAKYGLDPAFRVEVENNVMSVSLNLSLRIVIVKTYHS